MLHLRLQNPRRGSSPVMIYHNRFSLLSPAQMSLTLQVLPMHEHVWLLLSFSWVCYKEYLKNIVQLQYPLGFPGSSSDKESACQTRVAGGAGLIPGSGRSPGGRNSNPLQCSCLGNLMDGGAWWETAHRVTKSQTQLSNWALTQHAFVWKKKKKVKCMCLSNELIESLNFSLVWKRTLGLHHSL